MRLDEMQHILGITNENFARYQESGLIPVKESSQSFFAAALSTPSLASMIISPSNSMRRMSFFTLGTLNGWTETFQKQITGKNLLNSISDICVTFDYGFKLTFDSNNENLVFNLYKGVDRSFDQSENTHVIFSPDFENLGNTEYTADRTTFYNWVYVAGEGEGTARGLTLGTYRAITAKSAAQIICRSYGSRQMRKSSCPKSRKHSAAKFLILTPIHTALIII